MNNFQKFMIQMRSEYEERQRCRMSLNTEIIAENEVKLEKRDEVEEGKRLRADYEQVTGKMQKRVKIQHMELGIKQQTISDVREISEKSVRSIAAEQILSESSVSDGVIEYQPNYNNLFRCLCGKQQSGSMHLFLHIKQQHMQQSLAEIMLQHIQNKIMQNQPVNVEQLGIMEEMDLFDYTERLAAVARSVSAGYAGPMHLPSPANRGTYADMASIFLAETTSRPHEKKIVVAFFGYLRKYVEIHFGPADWDNQAPGKLVRSSNSIVALYQSTCKRYNMACPLSQEDVRQILYILSKWMLDNRWTNDRVLKVNQIFELTVPTIAKSQIGKAKNDFEYLQQESFGTIKEGMAQDSCQSQPELTYFSSNYTK